MNPTAEVADALVLALKAQIPAAGFRLLGIEVLLGELVDLDREELRAALVERLGPVIIEITGVPTLLKCDDCGAEYPSDEHPCPVCGSPRAHAIGGDDLSVARAWGEQVG